MILDWKVFSRRPEIRNLPLNEQLRKFDAETKRLTELNWFIDTRIAIGGSKPGAAAPGFTGQVIDGPINGAQVNAFDAAGLAIGSTTTNALGVFTFADVLPVGTTFTATGGTDSITGLSYTGTLRAEVSADVSENVTISPITTFAKYLKDERSITYDQAVIELFESSSEYFGQPLDYANRETILKKDFNAQALNGETEAIAALAVTSFMEGACEMMSAYEVGDGGANTIKKDAAYLAMAKQMATFTSSINLSACLEEVASDSIINEGGEPDELVTAKRNRTNTLLSNFKTNVFATMDEQSKAPNYLVTKLNGLNRTGKKFAATEVVNIKVAEIEDVIAAQSVAISDKLEEEITGLAQIEEGVTNKVEAEAAGSYTPHQLRVLSFGPDFVHAGTNPISDTGTFHTVDDDIGIGTILYANNNPEATAGATATAVLEQWGQSHLQMSSQFNLGNWAVGNMDHLHSNAYAILGDGLADITGTIEGKLITTKSANKFYKIQSKGTGSNQTWKVTEIYEGNPRLLAEEEDFTLSQKINYMPVTQSYEFPPMDITIKGGSDATGGSTLKVVTQEAVDELEQPEIAIQLDNIKFMYTGSTGAHMVSGSRVIAENHDQDIVTIQSNNQPSIKLRFNKGTNYQLMHNERILFTTNLALQYSSFYSNFNNEPLNADKVETNQWIIVGDAQEAINSLGGRIATQGEVPQLFFSGSNLGEGIS